MNTSGLRPCVKCLGKKIVRKRVGESKVYCVIQCNTDCGFNVTGFSFKEAEEKWNGFAVWQLVDNAKAIA